MKSTFSDKTISAEAAQTQLAEQNADRVQAASFSTAGLLADSELLLAHGRPTADPAFAVLINESALIHIEGHANSDLEREVGGILLGRSLVRRNGGGVLIENALAVDSDDNGPTHFTFTADSWAKIHADKERYLPELSIVGWFHTHPNLGAFFSASDETVHRAAFVMPWQIALVIDPLQREACLIGWSSSEAGEHPAELRSLTGLYEIVHHDNSSRFKWDYVEPRLSSQEQIRRDLEKQPGRVYTLKSDWPALPPIDPWWGVILGSLSLLLNLILLIDRFLLSPS